MLKIRLFSLHSQRGGFTDYALIMATFALLMFTALNFITHETGNNLTRTQIGFTNSTAS